MDNMADQNNNNKNNQTCDQGQYSNMSQLQYGQQAQSQQHYIQQHNHINKNHNQGQNINDNMNLKQINEKIKMNTRTEYFKLLSKFDVNPQQQNIVSNYKLGQYMNHNSNNTNNMHHTSVSNRNQSQKQTNMNENDKLKIINQHIQPIMGQGDNIECIKHGVSIQIGHNIKSCLKFLWDKDQLNTPRIAERLEKVYNYSCIVYEDWKIGSRSFSVGASLENGWSTWLIGNKYGRIVARYKIMIIYDSAGSQHHAQQQSKGHGGSTFHQQQNNANTQRQLEQIPLIHFPYHPQSQMNMNQIDKIITTNQQKDNMSNNNQGQNMNIPQQYDRIPSPYPHYLPIDDNMNQQQYVGSPAPFQQQQSCSNNLQNYQYNQQQNNINNNRIQVTKMNGINLQQQLQQNPISHYPHYPPSTNDKQRNQSQQQNNVNYNINTRPQNQPNAARHTASATYICPCHHHEETINNVQYVYKRIN